MTALTARPLSKISAGDIWKIFCVTAKARWKTFYTPIWNQVRDALNYIQTNIIEEKGVKSESMSELESSRDFLMFRVRRRGFWRRRRRWGS